METKIITEGLSSLDQKTAQKYDIYIIDSYLIKNGETLKDNEIDVDEYYREMRETQKPQKTAHANYHDLKSAFDKTLKKTDQVLYLAVTGKLSGTYDLSKSIASEYNDEKIQAYDTRALLGQQGLMCIEAAKLGKKGKTPQEIIKFLDQEKPYFGLLGCVDTLTFMVASGRLGKAQGFLGNLLSIKPVLYNDDGEAGPLAKVRTHKQGLEKVIEFIKEKQKGLKRKKIKLVFDYTDNLEWVKEVEKRFKKEFQVGEVIYGQASIAIGNHLGPGSWAVSYYFHE